MLTILTALLVLFVGCFAEDLASAIEENERDDSRIVFDIIGSYRSKTHILPIDEYRHYVDDSLQCQYSYFPPSFIITFSPRKNIDRLQYAMLNSYIKRSGNLRSAILRLTQRTFECGTRLFSVSIHTRNSTMSYFESIYDCCMHSFDLIGPNFCTSLGSLSFVIEGAVCLGCFIQKYGLVVNNSEADKYNLTCFITEQRNEHYETCPLGKEYRFKYRDNLVFAGISCIAKCIFEKEPFTIECSSKVCPHMGYVMDSSDVIGDYPPDYVHGENCDPIYPDIYSYSSSDSWMLAYPNVMLALNCKCSWDIPMENYNIQLGLGYSMFSLHIFYLLDSNDVKYENYEHFTWLSRGSNLRQFLLRFCTEREVYSGYILSMAVNF